MSGVHDKVVRAGKECQPSDAASGRVRVGPVVRASEERRVTSCSERLVRLFRAGVDWKEVEDSVTRLRERRCRAEDD